MTFTGNPYPLVASPWAPDGTDTDICDATAYGDECTKIGVHVWHLVAYPNGTSREWVGDRFEGPVERFCGACGEPEGSDYAKPCCSDDAMIEA